MTENSKPKRRCRPLRVERDDVLLFITSRTVEERFWLHPLLSCGARPVNRKARRALARFEKHCCKRYEQLAREANKRNGPFAPKLTGKDIQRLAKGLVGSALARAQENTGVQIFAFTALSNHIHMVIRTPRKNAADFLRDFKSNVARSINRISGRRGPLWARRADVQPILDDEAACGRVAYCVGNPKKARLVQDPETWPGLNMAFGIADTDEIPFEYFDTEAWHQAGRPKNLADFIKTIKLILSPLPCCDGSDRESYANDVRSWIAHQIGSETEQAERGKPDVVSKSLSAVLGISAVIEAAFTQRPKSPKRSKRPYCFGNEKNRLIHYEQMSHLLAVHEDCSIRFREGERSISFPSGTYPPPILSAAA